MEGHIELDDNGPVVECMLAQGDVMGFVVSTPDALPTCGTATVRRSSSSSASVVWSVTWLGIAREPVNSKASSSMKVFFFSQRCYET